MPLRIEIHRVEHPFSLCSLCNDSLGWNCVTFEPGAVNSRKAFACDEHLPEFLQQFGESIIRRVEEEKGNEDG